MARFEITEGEAEQVLDRLDRWYDDDVGPAVDRRVPTRVRVPAATAATSPPAPTQPIGARKRWRRLVEGLREHARRR